MTWPLSQDYNEAVQNPQHNFSDQELRQGQVVTSALGLPLPRSGNFADVYEFHCPTTQGRFAVKCFTREVPGLQERYSQISRHLHQARLPFTVDFQYQAEGIRVGNRWFPILKMQWVEGLLLNEFVRDTVERPALLEALMQIWTRMSRWLRDADVTHGDLQHGNVLLVPGSKTTSLAVKLIDYDGMFVPALADAPSHEVGHSSYQHPQRLREGTYGREVDRFSLLAVAAALRCVMVGGKTLWERYDNGDNLLFREGDLKAPGKSGLFKELWRLNDPAAHALVGHLVLACQGRLEQVLPLDELLTDGTPLPLKADQDKHIAGLLGGASSLVQAGPMPILDRNAATTAARPPREIAFDFGPEGGATLFRRKGPLFPTWAWVSCGLGILLLMVVSGILLWNRGFHSSNTEPRAYSTFPGNSESNGEKLLSSTRPDTLKTPPGSSEPTKPVVSPLPGGRVTQLAGHPGGTLAVACSVNGRLAVTGGADGLVRLWETATGRELCQLAGHKGPVLRVAISADGNRLLSSGVDKTVRLWDVPKRKELRQLPHHPDLNLGLAFSPKGDRAMTTGLGNFVRLWDLQTGEAIRRFEHPRPVACVAFSPKGSQFLAGLSSGPGEDNPVYLWDVESGKNLKLLEGHKNKVSVVVFSPKGERCLSAGFDKTARIWDLETGAEIQEFSGLDSILSGVYTPNGLLVVSGGGSSLVAWDPETGEDIQTFEDPNRDLVQLAVLPNSRDLLVANRRSAAVTFLSLPGRDQILNRPPEPIGEIRCYPAHPKDIRSLSVAPNGRSLLTACGDGLVRLLEVRTGRGLAQLKGHPGPVHAVTFCPDGLRAVSGGKDGTLRLWDLFNARELRSLAGLGEILAVAVAPAGDWAASASVETGIALWNLKEGKETQRLPSSTGATCVVFSPKGDYLASGGTNGLARLWDLDDSQEVRSFKGHTGNIYSIAFSPDGQLLVTGGEDGTVRLWNVATGLLVRRFPGVTGAVYAVALSADGRLVLAAGADRTLHLWETATAKEAPLLEGHSAHVWDVAFAPDGQHAFSASGGPDCTARYWHLPPASAFVARAATTGKSPERIPRPEEADLAAALEKVRKTYKSNSALFKPRQMSDLAEELFRESKKTEDDPPLRFALLREARDLYARGGYLNDALAMAEDLAKEFQVDALEEKVSALEMASHSPFVGASYFAQVGEHALHLLEDARALDQYDRAERLIKVVETIAKSSNSSNLAAQARNQKALLEKLGKEYARLKDALATLEKDPGNPQANLRLGHFQCFVKGHWDKGLPYLVKSSDPVLAALARKELDGSSKGKSLLDRADAWFEQAKKTEGSNKSLFQKRAYALFWQALGDLSDEEETHAENQIKVLIAQAPGLKSHWDSLNSGGALVMTYGKTEYLRLDANQTLSTRRSYSGRLDIQATFRTNRSNVTLEAFSGAGITLSFGSKKGEVRIQFPGKAERFSRTWPLVTNQWYSLRWLITEQGMAVRINDLLVFTEGKKNYDLSSKRPVKIVAGSSGLDVQSLFVTSERRSRQ